jgi:hypothetical protein
MYAAIKIEHLGLLAIVGAAVAAAVLLLLQPLANMSPGVLTWWIGLCVVSVFNIAMWRQSAAALGRRDALDRDDYRHQRTQLILSAVFVFGCAIRSMLPRADVQRFGLFDSWISSVLVGRSVATAAELCFAAQWALLLYRVARDADCRYGIAVAWLIVPLISVAEVFSWGGVLTTAYLGNAIEESIWTLSAALLLTGLAAARRNSAPELRPLLTRLCAYCTVYVAFMCLVDVPMYVARWRADEMSGKEYLSLSEGLWDAGSRVVTTHAWEQWRPEMPWMSLYFSLGVWFSLALIHIARPRPVHQLAPAAATN